MRNSPIEGLRPWIVMTALVALIMDLASWASAQSPAGVEIESLEEGGVDPHPITYFWDGDIKGVKEPVDYYTFYYTGKVMPDATTPVSEEIQRVAIPNREWDSYKNEIIAQLTSFYEEAYNVQPERDGGVGTDSQVTFDDDLNYVESQRLMPQGSQGIDPKAAAEWSLYYDQFVLWQYYCRRILLNERGARKASSSREKLKKYQDSQLLRDMNITDVEKALDEIDGIRTEQVEAAGGDLDAAAPATVFDPDADFDDPKHNDLYYDEFVRMTEVREKLAVSIFRDMLQRIEGRKIEQARYEDWIQTKERKLLDFARAWSKVQSGESVRFEDTFYLITKEPLAAVPAASRNVVARDVVTPQDLINRDGTLKGSEYQ